MSRIAIVGGHGKIALKLAKLLTESGHEVSSLIRNPDQTPDIEQAGATAVVADVENQTTEQIAGTIAEHDAVVVLRPPLGRVRLRRADEPGVVPERDGR